MEFRTIIAAFASAAFLGSAATGAVVSGYVEVIRTSDNSSLGFVANNYQTLGEFGITTTVGSRLLVSFDNAASRFSIEMLNSADSSYDYLGGIVGYSSNDDLGAGSSNYLYLGGTGQSLPGAGPTVGGNSFSDAVSLTRNYESAIWSLAGSQLNPHWVNTNLSEATVQAVFAQDVLILTGDAAAFTTAFGPNEAVTFRFAAVPESSSAILVLAGVGTVLLRRRRF